MIFRIHTKGYYLTMRLKDKFLSILKKYVKSIFNWSRQPKVLRFYGALGYHKNDDNVSLMTYDENVGKCQKLYFSFDEIVGIEKGK